VQELLPIDDKKLDSLYSVTSNILIERGGSTIIACTRESFKANFHCLGTNLLSIYQSSPITLLLCELPDHHWQPWRFPVVPRGLFQRVGFLLGQRDPVALEFTREFLIAIGETYSIKSLDDWYRIATSDLGSSIRRQLAPIGGLVTVLQKAFPAHPWVLAKFDKGKLFAQKALLLSMHMIFPLEGTQLIVQCRGQ